MKMAVSIFFSQVLIVVSLRANFPTVMSFYSQYQEGKCCPKCSLGYRMPLPLCVHDCICGTFLTIAYFRLVSVDIPELETALNKNVLKNYDTNRLVMTSFTNTVTSILVINTLVFTLKKKGMCFYAVDQIIWGAWYFVSVCVSVCLQTPIFPVICTRCSVCICYVFSVAQAHLVVSSVGWLVNLTLWPHWAGSWSQLVYFCCCCLLFPVKLS